MDEAAKQALKIANESGFPLQIAIEHLIRTSGDLRNHWKVDYREHSWVHVPTGSSGFIDLVVSDRHDSTFLIVECKRVTDAIWTFMNAAGHPKNSLAAKPWISVHGATPGMRRIGWAEAEARPMTPEAQFCAMRGQSSDGRGALVERIGGDLVLATEAFAQEHRDPRLPGESIRFYVSVIVTTAKLFIANFDPAAVALETGKFNQGEAQDVPFLRFRKQLSLRQPAATADAYARPDDFTAEKEHTVFIVNAEAFSRFLSEFEFPEQEARRLRIKS